MSPPPGLTGPLVLSLPICFFFYYLFSGTPSLVLKFWKDSMFAITQEGNLHIQQASFSFKKKNIKFVRLKRVGERLPSDSALSTITAAGQCSCYFARDQAVDRQLIQNARFK
ncbi:hypothetical protein M440DRAFT_1388443 [Trichoderma longibrachiatum ATCC 18648]|uniref:Uncharacterized protein n=1 Tax=Trichoderma longibrachiatum ATCC 18648 TaxID=983965 RepID=A0A2T4CEU5_TRILO|nr:hypothetical protein M440DRAFT_1388443 [Trichoderma longibrachiatum ATCC 18648]